MKVTFSDIIRSAKDSVNDHVRHGIKMDKYIKILRSKKPSEIHHANKKSRN